MTVNHIELRKRFLDFFDKRMKEHAKDKGPGVKPGVVLPLPSSSLQPPDASTLFTSAGMHQFKDDFMGNLVHGTRASATVQKCMRTPDLENVGKTARHHTFFEMIGFFSFGDGLPGPNGSVGFFKREAIRWIWDFYTLPWSEGGCGLDVKKLYVSVYGGDETGSGRDNEAADFWRPILGKIWPKEEVEKRIFWLGEHDNFWPAGAPSQGPNGVCGPCSEIFYDLGPEYGQGDVASNGNRFMEIGNIVFTQYDRSGPLPGKGVLTPLPAKNIDFGGGFERLVMVLEGARTTLDTSLFKDVREKLRALAARGKNAGPDDLVREKRIADHIRAVTFAMADGILPSNEGAGYVIRRIIRRAFRDGAALGLSGPFLHKLAPVIVNGYGKAYPELRRNTAAIVNTIQQEETQFAATLERGLQLLAGLIRDVKAKGEKTLQGKPAFDLYQSQGLPREVVQDELAAEGLQLDQVGYAAAEEKHRLASKGGKQVVVFEKGWFQELKAKAAPTEFVGYDSCEAQGRVLALARDGQSFEILEQGDSATVVLDRTPFYAESGGQVGDRGSLRVGDAVFEVADTKKRDDYWLHEGKLLHGKLRVGDAVQASVDGTRRSRIRAHHSATHLLHAALRTVLGEHVVQRGSEVGPDRLRFDFSHPKAVTLEERQKIEAIVNAQVQVNTPVNTRVTSPEEAQREGAMALFGEKYGDRVRVLSMGSDIGLPPMRPAGVSPALASGGTNAAQASAGGTSAARAGSRAFSVELCGGTHVAATGEIGYFRIVSEGSSSAGVRRIEGVTGPAAVELAAEEARTLAALHALTKAQPGKVVEKVEALLKEVKDLKAKGKKGGPGAGALDALRKGAEKAGGATLYAGEVEGAEAADLLTIKESLGQDAAPCAVLLGARSDEKVFLLLALSPDLVGRGLHAGKILGEIARLVDGGGGGKPETAQAGGKKPQALPEALEFGRKRLREALSK